MPRTEEQNREIREAMREKLLLSAMHQFAEQGYAHASIRKIAGDAGVSVGLMYHYYENKEQLLQAVFENCMAIISRGFSGVAGVENPTERTAFIVRYIFRALQEDTMFWSLFYSLRSQPAVMQVLGDEIRVWTARLRDLFVQFMTEAGEERPELQAYYLYSLIEGAIQQYLLDPDNYPLDAVVELILMRQSRNE